MNTMMARLATGSTLTQSEAVEKYGATTNLYTQARAALEIELGFKLPTGRPKKDAK
jgi:formylmethanofuran dehydrogenase subunit D